MWYIFALKCPVRYAKEGTEKIKKGDPYSRDMLNFGSFSMGFMGHACPLSCWDLLARNDKSKPLGV